MVINQQLINKTFVKDFIIYTWHDAKKKLLWIQISPKYQYKDDLSKALTPRSKSGNGEESTSCLLSPSPDLKRWKTEKIEKRSGNLSNSSLERRSSEGLIDKSFKCFYLSLPTVTRESSIPQKKSLIFLLSGYQVLFFDSKSQKNSFSTEERKQQVRQTFLPHHFWKYAWLEEKDLKN